MLHLHDVDTGELVLVEGSSLRMVRRIRSSPPDRTLNIGPFPNRTVIETSYSVALVKETPEEIAGLLELERAKLNERG